MRASRLVELLVRLQLRGDTSAAALASALDVSVRTIYRDVQALSAAGVPIYTETGRNGGIRIDPTYRIAGLPRLDSVEARSLLFAAVPIIAEQLGLDSSAIDRTLLPALESAAEQSARIVRDHLIIEPSHWFITPDDTPALASVARAVWDSREVRIAYRGTETVVQPLGLILKGDKWYLLGTPRRKDGRHRLYRVSRMDAVELLDHRFRRPSDFDLPTAWAERRAAFLDSIPEYFVTVRVAPDAESLLALLEEGRPQLPLDPDVERDADGWAHLRLRFEGRHSAARHLLRLGADVEVLAPTELRTHMASVATELAACYADKTHPRPQ